MRKWEASLKCELLIEKDKIIEFIKEINENQTP
jgi:hypothetical protein